MNKPFILFLLSLNLSASVFSAEVRVWEDKNGNRYEGEFLRELFDKITICDLNGREHRLPVEDLSEHDQKYIRVMIPPQIEIEQSRKDRLKPKPIELKERNRILFAQHSSACDVLMTTRCLKGLKERHGNIPLDYMTQEKYMDILRGNPNIDTIHAWDDRLPRGYKYYYNPHSDRILPGQWGRNANSILSDFYWKILMLEEPDDFFIELKCPQGLPLSAVNIDRKPICILHTTGGDPHFRSYRFMKDVHEGLKDRYFTIQLGGVDDYPAWACLDLRGKLTFREAAWVMSKATIAVTVDSFVSHLAGALGVSQVALYGSGNSNVCKPKQVKGRLITLSPDYIMDCLGLGPCSASVKDCPAPCTGRHTPESILNAIEKIEEEELYEAVSSGK